MGSYSTYSFPGKTAAFVPEFAVEDLPSSELQPRFLRLQKDLPLGRRLDDDIKFGWPNRRGESFFSIYLNEINVIHFLNY